MQSVLPRLLAGSLIVIAVDQASKFVFSSYHAITVIPDILSFTLTRNPGIAFSISFPRYPLVILTVAVMAAFCIFFFRNLESRTGVAQTVFVLIVGGGIGNLIDRMLWGTVTDFIAISSFPVFNLADAAVAIGAILLVWKYPTIQQKLPNTNPTAP